MAVTLSKTSTEIEQLPLVELAWEILKNVKEPMYFRDIMKEIQQIRKMSEGEVNEYIARLYTEINIDGRFVCIGQNVWGLNRWYPVDKSTERATTGKKFVRRTGDAFSEDDEEEDEFDELNVEDDLTDSSDGFDATGVETDTEGLVEEDLDADEEEEDVDEEFSDEEPLVEDEDDEDED